MSKNTWIVVEVGGVPVGVGKDVGDGCHEMICNTIFDKDSNAEEIPRLRREAAMIADALNGVGVLTEALTWIAKGAGNLPDASHCDKTGPNDARHRGLMLCEMRRLARAALGLPRLAADQGHHDIFGEVCK